MKMTKKRQRAEENMKDDGKENCVSIEEKLNRKNN